MNRDTFHKLYPQEYEIEPRYARLLDKLYHYYELCYWDESSNHLVPNKVINRLWREFRKWCNHFDYTNDDILRAIKALNPPTTKE